jgi:hypothetical protein
MIKCLDSENAYKSYPIMDQGVDVRKTRNSKYLSMNKLISIASQELVRPEVAAARI